MKATRLLLPLFLLGGLCAQDPTDAQHYKLEIELDFATKTIVAKCTATFRCAAASVASMSVDLAPSLAISSVQMNAANVPFSRSGNAVSITLDRTYATNELFTFEISYAGAPAGGGFGGFQWVTHGTSASPMAWTLSEPFYAYTWWPAKETLSDKSTSETWITHPNTMSAASNGLRQGIDTLSGNRLRTRWKTNYQIMPYLVSIAVTDYVTRTDTYTGFGANMPVEFYVFPESFTSWTSGMNLLVPMLNAYSGVYGQYPFVQEKYGIAQFTWGGGMEHQTMTSQSSVSEYLSAHELAHQWWGDNVTCGTWSDIWLNEGFATFSEALWAEKKAGGTIAAYHTKIRQTRPSSSAGTVYVYNPTSVANIFNTTNVYNKGSWVLHQLRHVLGDATFFQALLNYRATFTGKSATTADFRASCEQTAGRDLKWFFDQWVMNPGAPNYQHAGKVVNRGGKDWLYFEVDQTQTTPNVCTMPIDVVVQTGAGAVTRVVFDDERNDQFAIPLPAAATSWTFDPDQWILRGTTTSRTFTTPFFASDAEGVDTVAGGSVGLHLDLGATRASRPYLVLAGYTGTTPGTNVFGLQVPLNFDALTTLGLELVNTSAFANFYGSLDALGGGLATFALPAGVATPLKGTNLHFAAILVDAFDFATRPVKVRLE